MEYLTAIISGLIDNQENLTITRNVDARGVVFTVDLPKEEIGRVIGKDGETARSIRKLMRAYGFRNNERISVRILDNNQ